MTDKTYIDKLGWIVVKDRKHLVVKPKGKNYFLTPGGKREKAETDQAALIREAKEELSVDLIPETIKYYDTFEAQAQGKPEGTNVRIICYTADYKGDLQPNSEIESLGWINSEQGEEYTATGKLILEDLKKNELIN